jgi:hypothetical protein
LRSRAGANNPIAPNAVDLLALVEQQRLREEFADAVIIIFVALQAVIEIHVNSG